MKSDLGELSWDPEALGNSLTVLGINLVEKLDHLLLDFSSGTTETAADVLDQMSPVSFIHYLPEQSPGLLEIVIGVLMRVSARETCECKLSLLLAWVLNWAVLGVGLVIGTTTLVSIDGGGAISLIVSDSSSVGAVDGDLIEVSTESVSVGVGVREESALEHLVCRWLNTWDSVSGSKGYLLSLSEIVLRVLVEEDLANWDERVILLGDCLSHVENVELVVFALLLGDELNVPCPRGEVALSDVFVKVLRGIVLVGGGEILSLLASEVLDALIGLEVILDIVNFALLVHPLVGVRAVPIQMSETIGGATI